MRGLNRDYTYFVCATYAVDVLPSFIRHSKKTIPIFDSWYTQQLHKNYAEGFGNIFLCKIVLQLIFCYDLFVLSSLLYQEQKTCPGMDHR